MENTETWLKRDEEALASVLPRVFDVVAESGEGSWLIDVDGKRYLDFTSGIAVTSVGHCNPVVVEAIERQARRLLHTSVVTHNTLTVELAEKLRASVPYIEDAQVFFSNSGAEVVDGGLKLARKVTHRPGVIAFRRAFHGRTLGATSITTARGKYRSGYEPLLSSVHIAPYCIDGDVKAALKELDEILTLQAPDEAIGAMIVEPVLGEGGYVVPPVEWLQGLRERCDDRGIVLIFDEVQCGIARTGSMFAAETFGVTPDVILFAKGIANGMPLSGIIASRSLMEKWPTGAHGTTFGGNPVSCAAALATLSVIESQGLCQRAKILGERIITELKSLNSPAITDIRGLGLMIGIQMVDAATADKAQQYCLENGMLVLTCGAEENVFRLAPPLTVTDDEVTQALAILSAALN